MLWLVGFFILGAVFAIILSRSFGRDRTGKRPQKTVSRMKEESSTESDSRYKSVTATVGDMNNQDV